MRLNLPALVVMFCLGLVVATVGATTLQEASEDAKATKCKANLKELAIAVHSHHDVHRRMPAFTASNSDFYGGWTLLLLPYLEDEKTFESFALVERGESETNLPIVSGYRGDRWQCPARRSGATYDFEGEWATNSTGTTFEDVMPTDYVAVHTAGSEMWTYEANGIIVNPRHSVSEVAPYPFAPTSMASCTDGTANTAMFGEKHMHEDWLGKAVSPENPNDGIDMPLLLATNGPQFIRVGGDTTAFGTLTLAPKADYDTKDDPFSVNLFGSWHDGYTHFVNVDAGVREVGNFADPTQLRYYFQRNDRQSIGFPLKQTRDR